MAELFRTAADDMVCSYYDFRLLMENLSLNENNRKRKAKQAVRFLCEKQDAAFVDGENSLRELRRLDQCPSVLARLEKILKDGEELLKTMLPEIFQPDSPEAEAMRKKIMDAMQAELQRRSREAAEKLYRKQQELIARHERQEDIRKILGQGYMDESALLTKSLHPLCEDKYDVIVLAEFEYRLKMWREKQVSIVEKELMKLIPQKDYYCVFGGYFKHRISVEDAKKQAKELSNNIVDLVYQLRLEKMQKYHGQPLGGTFGNIVSLIPSDLGERQYQCGDWAHLFYNRLQSYIQKWFYENKNSFRIEWYRKPPYFYHMGEHNLIRICGANGKFIYIDPWPSGGKDIVRQEGKWNHGFTVYKQFYFPNLENKNKTFDSGISDPYLLKKKTDERKMKYNK